MDIIRYSLVLITLYLVASCAQVGTISGGAKDTVSPRPLANKISPPNESVNYQGNTFEITFDEYFRLSNPVQNIVMVPPHARIRATVRKKTLLLSWDEQLKTNTTYAIYLNRVVKDISEGNDSILQFVFSTGPEIDSLYYSVTVQDAWSGNPVKQSVVALYNPEDSLLVNFAQTNSSGKARLNYLAPGKYYVRAFLDENLDNQPQMNELMGFPLKDEIILTSGTTDSLPIRLFRHEQKPGVKQIKAISSGKYFLTTTNRIDSADMNIYVDGKLQKDNYRQPALDSLVILTESAINKTLEIVVATDKYRDTVSVPRSPSSQVKVSLAEKNTALRPYQQPKLEANATILNIDTSKITVFSVTDSVKVNTSHFIKNKDLLSVSQEDEDKNPGDFKIILADSAVETVLGFNRKTELSFSRYEKKDYGKIMLDLSDYEGALVVYCMKQDKVVEQISVSDPSSVVKIDYLLPGEYSFRIVVDKNKNGVWDTGSLLTKTQPEDVHFYSEKTKVRANWEANVEIKRALDE